MNERILCGLFQLFAVGLVVVSCLAFAGCSSAPVYTIIANR